MSDVSETGQDLVPARNPNGVLQEWGFDQLLGRYYTSIDNKAPNANKRLFGLIQEPGIKMDTWLDKEVKIVEFLFTPSTFADQDTGEMVTTLISKLRLSTGELLVTHSKGVAKALANAAPLLGLPSSTHPYVCTVRAMKTSPKKTMWYLEFPSI